MHLNNGNQHASYSVKESIRILTNKIKLFTQKEENPEIILENNLRADHLLSNVSLLISHIILKLNLGVKCVSDLTDVIEEYNTINNTSLSVAEFERKGLIRIVAEEIVLPEVIFSEMCKLMRQESSERFIDIPTGRKDLTTCLFLYFNKFNVNSELTINKDDLDQIITTHSLNGNIIGKYILDQIVELQEDGIAYKWLRNSEYNRCLCNEVASTLWFLVCGNHATINEFRKFIRILDKVGLSIPSFKYYLNSENRKLICELAVEFLNSESDLLVSEFESLKIHYDSPMYRNTCWDDNIPIHYRPKQPSSEIQALIL